MKTIADYPMLVVDPKPDDIMWIFDGEWSILDNFAPLPIEVDIGWGRKVYPTSEHAFAAAKTNSPRLAENIRKAPTPAHAKGLGRACNLKSSWEDIKFRVMWHVLQHKFGQHPEACKALLQSNDRLIFEGTTWEDRVWGVVRRPGSTRWEGRNALGSMLMEIRGTLNVASTVKRRTK